MSYKTFFNYHNLFIIITPFFIKYNKIWLKPTICSAIVKISMYFPLMGKNEQKIIIYLITFGLSLGRTNASKSQEKYGTHFRKHLFV